MSGDEREDGVEHSGGTAALQEREQPRHASRAVHRFRMSCQQSVTHVVHHRRHVLLTLLGHSGQTAGERRDVQLPIILSGNRGYSCQRLVSVANDVITVPKDI